MKLLLTILLLTFSSALISQELVVFHYNFSFEEEFTTGWNNTNPANRLAYVTTSIYDQKKQLVYKKHFEKPDFVTSHYGICLLADTTKLEINTNTKYTLSVKYRFVNKSPSKSVFRFVTVDSLPNLALELFFDQAQSKDSLDFDTITYKMPQYEVIKYPKPALIIKYLRESVNPQFMPTWFEYSRLTRRPVYIFKNTSNDTMYTVKRNSLSGLKGHLDLLDIKGNWKPYFFGAVCGTGSELRFLSPGEATYLEEAFAIGNPLKLQSGFYKYSVKYLDSNKNYKAESTYFSIIYSK